MNGPLTDAEIAQLHAELDNAEPVYIIGYIWAALSGAVFTLICLGVGLWLRGGW